MGVSIPLGFPPGVLGGGANFLRYMQRQIDTSAAGAWMLDFQELTGSYPQAYNTALAEGRQLALLTYASYTAGAGWSNPSAELATHAAAGGTATLSQAGLLQPGRTFKLVTIISGCTAGTVTPTGGAAISADGTNTQTIMATDTALIYTPTTDFDGTINCATVALTQTSILASSAYPGAELLVDGTMEAANTAAWTARTSATLTKQTTTPYEGSRCLRVAHGGTDGNVGVKQAVLTVGKRYRTVGRVRSDGTTIPKFFNIAVLWTGTTSTDWQPFDLEFVAAAAEWTFYHVGMTAGQYFELDACTCVEVNPLNASNTGATVHTATGNPHIPYGYLFDGTNDDVNAYSITLNSFFNPLAGTLNIFAQAPAAAWLDGVSRHLVSFRADVNNRILIAKNTVNGRLDWYYKAGGVEQTSNRTSISTTNLMMITLTWDKAADAVIAYFNGVKNGNTMTGLGTWVGNLSSTVTLIGAGALTPTNVWSGLLAYPTLFRSALTPAQILQIAQQAGVST